MMLTSMEADGGGKATRDRQHGQHMTQWLRVSIILAPINRCYCRKYTFTAVCPVKATQNAMKATDTSPFYICGRLGQYIQTCRNG